MALTEEDGQDEAPHLLLLFSPFVIAVFIGLSFIFFFICYFYIHLILFLSFFVGLSEQPVMKSIMRL